MIKIQRSNIGILFSLTNGLAGIIAYKQLSIWIIFGEIINLAQAKEIHMDIEVLWGIKVKFHQDYLSKIKLYG